jgi:hypothetical protein
MEIVANLVLFVLLAVVFGAIALVVLLIRNALRPTYRAPGSRPPSPPDDWDDEEISARYHH